MNLHWHILMQPSVYCTWVHSQYCTSHRLRQMCNMNHHYCIKQSRFPAPKFLHAPLITTNLLLSVWLCLSKSVICGSFRLSAFTCLSLASPGCLLTIWSLDCFMYRIAFHCLEGPAFIYPLHRYRRQLWLLPECCRFWIKLPSNFPVHVWCGPQCLTRWGKLLR